jgi:nitrous oxide reductase accessory protein NosL
MKRPVIPALVLLLFTASTAWAASAEPATPSPKDKCPVCGMFVAKYPDWLAQIVFADGSVVFFDGVKDLFKYYFDLKRYQPKKKAADVSRFYVTEYYNLRPIDAKSALFVVGGDVYGPMGRELIPFSNERDAMAFMKDHKGRQIVKFPDVNPTLIRGLD